MDEQFRRVIEWLKKGVNANVDGSDHVELFIYSFTFRHYDCADPETAPPFCNEP